MIPLVTALVCVFALDRGVKVLAGALAANAAPRPSRGKAWLTLCCTRNPSPVFWPSGSGRSWLLAFSLASAASVALVLLTPDRAPLLPMALGAALGGALSNLYDRLRHGAVLDLVRVRGLGTFNPADAALTLGLLGVFLQYLSGLAAGVQAAIG